MNMDSVGIICSIIAAFGSIIAVIFSYLSWRDSRRNLLKKIDKRMRMINKIENQLFLQERSSFWRCGDDLKIKKDKLQSEVDYLKKLF